MSQYVYDAEGKRVRRNAQGQDVWMIYGAGGELVAEYTSAGTAAPKEYGYRDGQLLITASPNLDAQAQSSMVVHLYQTILNRTPSTGEVQYWLNQGLTNVDAFKSVARQMFDSQEYINRNRTDREFVYDCYEAYLYREPETGGWDFWTGLVPSQGRVNIRENGFASSQEFADRVARTLAGETLWLTADQLGTPRIISDASGSLANIKRHDYLPFGEELTTQGGRTTQQGYVGDSVRQKFTSKERDDETGLDYFLARYYSSAQGRFTSPDEFTGGPDDVEDFTDRASANPTFYADLYNPQSLNKYQYAYNNPLRYIDPDGHETDEPDPQGQDQTRGVPTLGYPFRPMTQQEANQTLDALKQLHQDIRDLSLNVAIRQTIGNQEELGDRDVPPVSIPPLVAPLPQTGTPPNSRPMPPPAPIQYHPPKKQSTGKNKDHPKETERPGAPNKRPPGYRPFRRPDPKPKPPPKPPKPKVEPKPEIGPDGNPVRP